MKGPGSILAVLGGILFTLLWLAGAAVLGAMKFMAGAMANDAGQVGSELHASLFLLLMAGQCLTAAAGIPAGLAFFWRTKRRKLLLGFGLLLILGIVAQAWAAFAFTRAAD